MSKFRWIGAFLVGLALPTIAAAQSATVVGKVTNETGTPMRSVSVFVQGINVGALTGPDGNFSFQVPAGRFTDGQRVQLLAQLIGYRAEAHEIVLRAGQSVSSNFALTLDPLRLTEVVATGSGTQTRRERLGTSVSTVAAAEIRRANETNVVQALAGKVPNVVTNQQSGDAGASTAIQIRGAKSFGGSQPLIVVDGIPINNNTRTTSGTPLQGAVSPNRASDINPEDIESIEILKGAAATSIYGASAGSAGAILITTKRGQAGRTQYTLRSTYQADKPVQIIPLQRKFGVGANGVSSQCTTTNCSISANFFSFGPELPAGTPTFDHAAEMYETGRMWDNTLSMSGGNERTTFYLSLGGVDHNGFMVSDNDTYKRYTVRFNGSHELMNNLTLGASGSYVQTKGSGNQRGNQTGGILGALRTPPEFNNQQFLTEEGMHRSWRFPNPGPTAVTNNRGFDNPFYFIHEAQSTAEVGRYFGNVSANYRPFEWLTLNYTLGADYASDDRTEAFPQQASGGASGGLITRWQFYDRIIDHTLTANGSWQLTPKVLAGLVVGQNLNETYFRQVSVTGQTWIAPEPFKLSNTVTRQVPNDAESRTRIEGYFAQASTDINDQLFLQARIRNDGNSRFGVGNQRAWYPGGSAAWSFTKMIALPENIVSFGKVRVAYGETGQQPPIYATQDLYTAAAFADFNPGSLLIPTQAGFGGLYTSATKGNPDIRPERVKELEGGIDLSLFRGRSDFSLTRYDSKSTDVVFFVSTPPSTGFTSQVLNAAELTNKGWEATLNVRPIQREGFTLEIGANWARNRNLVTSLGALDVQLNGTVDMPTPENCGDVARVPRCEIGFSSSFAGQSTHAQVGYPLGVWRSQDFARCGRGLTTLAGNNDIEAACAGAPDGALYIAANGYPITDPNTRVVGDPQPDWTGGLSLYMNIKGVEISAFIDHRHGGDVLNMTRASIYGYGTHKDTELRGELRTFGKDWLCHNKTCDVLNGPVVGPGAGTAVALSENWFTVAGGVGGPATQRIEDGTNTRLREVSVGYSFSAPWVQKLAGTRQLDVKVSGRNLKLWTDYSGFDPETNLGGADAANRGIDWFNNPLSRAWVVSVALHH